MRGMEMEVSEGPVVAGHTDICQGYKSHSVSLPQTLCNGSDNAN
jgi:hypothetical protein